MRYMRRSQAKKDLQDRPDKVVGILHTPHEVWRNACIKDVFIATTQTPRAAPIMP